MSCFTMKMKLSNSKKTLKRLISKMRPKLLNFSTHQYDNQKVKAQKGDPLAYMSSLYIESSSMHDKDYICCIAPAVGVGAMEMEQVEDQEYDQDLEDDHAAVCSSLQLHGVDARAEEFIRKRREAWKIERQKSLDEYFEMLARGI